MLASAQVSIGKHLATDVWETAPLLFATIFVEVEAWTMAISRGGLIRWAASLLLPRPLRSVGFSVSFPITALVDNRRQRLLGRRELRFRRLGLGQQEVAELSPRGCFGFHCKHQRSSIRLLPWRAGVFHRLAPHGFLDRCKVADRRAFSEEFPQIRSL